MSVHALNMITILVRRKKVYRHIAENIIHHCSGIIIRIKTRIWRFENISFYKWSSSVEDYLLDSDFACVRIIML